MTATDTALPSFQLFWNSEVMHDAIVAYSLENRAGTFPRSGSIGFGTSLVSEGSSSTGSCSGKDQIEKRFG